VSLYTIEIDGRPILVFAAEDDGAAEDFAADEDLRAELLGLEHEGEPIWDGDGELVVRRAHLEEASEWEGAHAKALLEGAADEDDEDFAVFLLEVSDLTNEYFDADDDG
jgi:hypothetical protein